MGFFALLAACDGASRVAFLLLMGALIVDVTDGLLARRIGVRVHLPHFSGARVDDAVDVLTYIYVPLFILAREGLLPHPAWLIPPLLAGLYAYGQRDMKTDDHYFLGFPSYWNVVALYLFWLRPAPLFAVTCVLLPTLLTVIPTRYLYPSRNATFWKTNFILGGMWVVFVCGLLLWPDPSRKLIWLSLSYPVTYMGLSFYADGKLRAHARRKKTTEV